MKFSREAEVILKLDGMKRPIVEKDFIPGCDGGPAGHSRCDEDLFVISYGDDKTYYLVCKNHLETLTTLGDLWHEYEG